VPTQPPNRFRKRLGVYLRQLRRDAGKTAAEVAKILDQSEASMSLYEGGQTRPGWPAVQLMLNLYAANPDQQAEARTLWEEAATRALHVHLPADAPKDLRKLVRAEHEGWGVRVLSPLIIPGLLQTEAYMRALTQAGRRLFDSDVLGEYLRVRLNRQKRLNAPNPLHLHALVDEAALRRLIGGADVMRHQLGHLLAVGAQPNVTVQVLPFDAGAYGSMGGACTIVDYLEPMDPPGVYVEYLGGGDWVENGDAIERIASTFDDVRATALSQSDSADLIRQYQRAREIE
jgi:transcriptional regulator with XRE-family HTH domain